jgi:hypothetical protein
MEVAERTAADRKGGHLARRRADGRLVLRESAMCPDGDTAAFEDVVRCACVCATCEPSLIPPASP